MNKNKNVNRFSIYDLDFTKGDIDDELPFKPTAVLAKAPPHPPAKPVPFAYAVPPCTLASAPAPVHGFMKVTQWPGF
jgi:hypothetical protein